MISWNRSWATMVSRSTAGTAGALAVGQAQAAPDGLLDQGVGVGGAERDDGVEVGDVPALLEHVDVDDDLGRVVRVLDGEELLDRLVLLLAVLVRVDRRSPCPCTGPPKKSSSSIGALSASAWVGVLGDDQHERLDPRRAVLAGVDVQVDLVSSWTRTPSSSLMRSSGLLRVVRRRRSSRGSRRRAPSRSRRSVACDERVAVDDVLERGASCRRVSTCGVAVSSSPRIGFSSLMALTPAAAR